MIQEALIHLLYSICLVTSLKMKLCCTWLLFTLSICTILTTVTTQQCFKKWDIGLAVRISSINDFLYNGFSRFGAIKVRSLRTKPDISIPVGSPVGFREIVGWNKVQISNIELRANIFNIHEGRLDVSFKTGDLFLEKHMIKPNGDPYVAGLAPITFNFPLAGKTVSFRVRVSSLQLRVSAMIYCYC